MPSRSAYERLTQSQIYAIDYYFGHNALNAEEYGYTPFQLFVLAYLAVEELKQREKDEILDASTYGHHSFGTVIPEQVTITIREVSVITPSSIIPDSINQIPEELHELDKNGLLEWNVETKVLIMKDLL